MVLSTNKFCLLSLGWAEARAVMTGLLGPKLGLAVLMESLVGVWMVELRVVLREVKS